MSYDNHFTGAITITPPLGRPQIREVQDGHCGGITDVRLRISEIETESDDGETVMIRSIADAIVPLDMSYSGHSVAKDIQAIIDHFPAHDFTGHIQVQWDPGFEDPIPTRYIVRDRRVAEVRPTLVWPDEPRPATMSATDLAVVLTEMAGLVVDHDSFGGTITYEITDRQANEYDVTATYRTGNTTGQGGTRIIEGRG